MANLAILGESREAADLTRFRIDVVLCRGLNFRSDKNQSAPIVSAVCGGQSQSSPEARVGPMGRLMWNYPLTLDMHSGTSLELTVFQTRRKRSKLSSARTVLGCATVDMLRLRSDLRMRGRALWVTLTKPSDSGTDVVAPVGELRIGVRFYPPDGVIQEEVRQLVQELVAKPRTSYVPEEVTLLAPKTVKAAFTVEFGRSPTQKGHLLAAAMPKPASPKPAAAPGGYMAVTDDEGDDAMVAKGKADASEGDDGTSAGEVKMRAQASSQALDSDASASKAESAPASSEPKAAPGKCSSSSSDSDDPGSSGVGIGGGGGGYMALAVESSSDDSDEAPVATPSPSKADVVQDIDDDDADESSGDESQDSDVGNDGADVELMPSTDKQRRQATTYQLDDLANFNERFQQAIQQQRVLDRKVEVGENELRRVSLELINVARDFLFSSTTYGKILISEVYLPYDAKTIRPVNLGGIIGGDKYIVNSNILFKFAWDQNDIFGHIGAAKVAGHELKGVTCYYNCGIPNLCVPFQALIDYKGFRLIAAAMCPITSNTLVMGSADAGATVKADDEGLQKLMAESARILNLKPHVVQGKQMYTAVDVEGHLGIDGRYMLIDLSRTCPPERPSSKIRGGHLYRLLRVELLQSYAKPLCSDAYSVFLADDPECDQHNVDVTEATRFLKKEVIPNTTRSLERQYALERETGTLDAFAHRLTRIIHSHGINCRYFGLLFNCSTSEGLRTMLLIEMTSRVVKQLCRSSIRERMEQLRVPLDQPYIELVVALMNRVFADKMGSKTLWEGDIRTALVRYFGCRGPFKDTDQAFDVKAHILEFPRGMSILFTRVQDQLGLIWSKRIQSAVQSDRFDSFLRQSQCFFSSDLLDLGIRTKHMNVMSQAQGFIHMLDARHSPPEEATALLQLSSDKFEEALNANPTHVPTLRNYARVLSQLYMSEHATVDRSFWDRDVQIIYGMLRIAVQSNPKDTHSLVQMADFLCEWGMWFESIRLFVRGVMCHGGHWAAITGLRTALNKISMVKLAEMVARWSTGAS